MKVSLIGCCMPAARAGEWLKINLNIFPWQGTFDFKIDSSGQHTQHRGFMAGEVGGGGGSPEGQKKNQKFNARTREGC